MRSISFLLPLFCFALLSMQAVAQENEKNVIKPLTLGRALQYTYQNNPEIQAARVQFSSVAENISQALAKRRPVLNGSAGVDAERSNTQGAAFVTGRTDNVSKDYGVTLDQPLFRGFRNFNEPEAAKLLTQSQKYALIAIENDVLQRAVQAYMDLNLAQSLVELNDSNVELLSKQLEAAQARFDVGELSRTDVAQARARYAGAKADLVAAKGRMKTAQTVFQRVIGLPVNDLVVESAIDLPVPADLSDVLEIASRESPELLSIGYAHRAAEKDVESVFGELWPTISIQGQYGKAYDTASGAVKKSEQGVIGLRATIPLYQGGATRSRIRQSKYDAQQLLMQARDVERSVRQAVTEDWESLLSAQAEIESRSLQVDAANIAREGTYEEALLGERTVLDSLDADQDLLSASVDLATARRNEIVARFSLAAELGLLQPDKVAFLSGRTNYDEIMKKAGRKLFSTDIEDISIRK